jgi:hypothetical protein
MPDIRRVAVLKMKRVFHIKMPPIIYGFQEPCNKFKTGKLQSLFHAPAGNYGQKDYTIAHPCRYIGDQFHPAAFCFGPHHRMPP